MTEVVHNLFRLLGNVLTSCVTDPTLITSGEWSGQNSAISSWRHPGKVDLGGWFFAGNISQIVFYFSVFLNIR